MSHFDHRTYQCELEVQRITYLKNLANQLPDAFIDTKKVIKSHIPTANALARIDVPEGQLANESQIRLKHGRPIGSKDITALKKRTQRKINAHEEANMKQKVPTKACGEQKAPIEAYNEQETLKKVRDKEITPEEAQIPENYDISLSYVHKGYKWDRNDIVINNIFYFQVALNIIRNDEDPEPQNVEEC